MKRGKTRSNVAVQPIEIVPEEEGPPLDTLTVNIQNLRVMDEEPNLFSVKVTFYDQLIVSGITVAVGAREVVNENTLLSGYMNYDPSDYERMSLLADNPLCVQIQPLKSSGPNSKDSEQYLNGACPSPTNPVSSTGTCDVSCCNIDILSLIIGKDKKKIIKRMQPLIKPSLMYCKSWDNLPIITLEVIMTRNPLNEHHHKVLKEANYMKLTLVASYNMIVPYDNQYTYTAASKMPIHNENETIFSTVIFNEGYQMPKRFNSLCFNSKWETLRIEGDTFSERDSKFQCTVNEIQNDDNIPLERYMNDTEHTTVWGSFHRTLMLQHSERSLRSHIQKFQWPLEVHIYGEGYGYSFMAFLNLFNLLYPGEDTVRVAVPLQWLNADAMYEKCGCELLLTPNEKASSIGTKSSKGSKGASTARSEPAAATNSDAGSFMRCTGADENNAFVLVEVKLAKTLRKVIIPPYIPISEINNMLYEMEQTGPLKRQCSGRGQQDRDWQSTVRSAASCLRKVPYYGMTEFCNFNRQLSETRTRVELITSCWQDAAIYVNNNFVIQNFLQSDDTFEEMLMMAHACLMRSVCTTIVGEDNKQDMDSTLRAARQARQMQDIPHAMELYLQLVVKKPRDANCWRELSTCMKDVDRDWANVCINKSVVLDPRHPISLISKGCMIFEEDPDLAEPFFVTLLVLYPFWSTAWVIASAYYLNRELFHMADQVLFYCKKFFSYFLPSRSHQEGLSRDLDYLRTGNYELGDWWDCTPILPGMSAYYDAADMLLRLRAFDLAEVCVARALCENGESAAYFHLVALCCRLRGNVDDALCHIRTGIEKYGEVSYLRSLEAECYHKQKNIAAARAAFDKAGSCIGAYSILLSSPCREPQRARTILVDLVRRHPSAYVWMALADDWMARASPNESGDANTSDGEVAAKSCAAACAMQALKWDRRAGRAWALLSTLVRPSARRLFCLEMAKNCGYSSSEVRTETRDASKQSLCYSLGRTLRECNCKLCEPIQF